MEVMVEIRNLTKHFGPIRAVDDISFDVRRGEVLGFLGPNGAGKSTTMKMITCFLGPTGGTVRVCGHGIHSDSLAVRRKIGYLPEGAPAYPDMTPASFLDFVADVRGLRGADKRKRIDHVVGLIGIGEVMRQPIDTLSKGFKRRVGLAQAILHDPDVLILDEPTDGLDPNQKHEVRTLIREMARDKAIILSTHILEEVEAVCTRAIIIAHGRIIFDGTPAELEARSRYHNAVTLKVDAPQADRIAKELKELAGVAAVDVVSLTQNGKQGLIAYPVKGRPIVGDIAQLARTNNWRVEEIRSETGRLDEVFRTLTTTGKEERS